MPSIIRSCFKIYMLVKITAKIRKRINLVFKIIMISLVYLFLFFELSKNNQSIWQGIFSKTNYLQMNYIWFALFLMPVNWLIESVKWRYLVRKIERVKIWDAFQAVLAGTAISIFTPNRIGDYLGRIFILKEGDRIDGTVATIVGNISQLIVTIIMGSIAIFYFMDDIDNYFFGPHSNLSIYLRILIIIIDVLVLYTFFLFPELEKKLNKDFEIFRYPIIRHLNLLSEYKSSELINVLLFSLLRFMIYSFQFYLLFLAFHIHLGFTEGILFVFLIFFGITIIPSIALAELGIRGIISIFIFNVLWANDFIEKDIETSLVSATSLLWLINLAIPAIIGGLFIFKLRFLRKSDILKANTESLT